MTDCCPVASRVGAATAALEGAALRRAMLTTTQFERHFVGMPAAFDRRRRATMA